MKFDSDSTKANFLASHFAKTFDRIAVDNGSSGVIPNVPLPDSDLTLTEQEVYAHLINLGSKQNLPADGFPKIFLRDFALFLSEPLFMIFKRSYATSTVPNIMKLGIVTPIFKKGARSDPSNYRPVTQCSIAAVFNLGSADPGGSVEHFLGVRGGPR